MIGLPYGDKNYDNMLSRFHLIPERHGRTDGRTDRQTDVITTVYISVLTHDKKCIMWSSLYRLIGSRALMHVHVCLPRSFTLKGAIKPHLVCLFALKSTHYLYYCTGTLASRLAKSHGQRDSLGDDKHCPRIVLLSSRTSWIVSRFLLRLRRLPSASRHYRFPFFSPSSPKWPEMCRVGAVV